MAWSESGASESTAVSDISEDVECMEDCVAVTRGLHPGSVMTSYHSGECGGGYDDDSTDGYLTADEF